MRGISGLNGVIHRGWRWLSETYRFLSIGLRPKVPVDFLGKRPKVPVTCAPKCPWITRLIHKAIQTLALEYCDGMHRSRAG